MSPGKRSGNDAQRMQWEEKREKKSRRGKRYLENTVNEKKEWKVGVSTE